MQSSDNLPAKKPKPNNKTKTLAKKRSGEDFKKRACNSSRKSSCSENNTHKPVESNKNQTKNKIENTNNLHIKPENDIVKKNNSKENREKTSKPLPLTENPRLEIGMNSIANIDETKSRQEILAARQAKKNAKKISNTNNNVNVNNIEKNESNGMKVLNKTEGDKPVKTNKNNSTSCTLSAESNNLSSAVSDTSKQNHIQIDKNREEIMAERQAKKLAKQTQKVNKSEIVTDQGKSVASESVAENVNPSAEKLIQTDKTRDDIIAEREAKKLAKQSAKIKNKESVIQSIENVEKKLEQNTVVVKPTIIPEKKPPLSKAERRATQDAQRAAKAKMQEDKQKKPTNEAAQKVSTNLKPEKNNSLIKENQRQKSPLKSVASINEYKVKLFKHLDREDLQEKNQFINHPHLHPAIVQLGEQILTRTVVGSNARCISFLKALKILIQDYQTPPKKEFTRGLEESINNSVQYLGKCRPLAVSVSNAHKTIQSVLRHLSNDKPESELKKYLCDHIETYIHDQIEKAAQAISEFVQEKISQGDVILTYSCSSLIYQILEDAHNRKIDFRVIVVDSRPFLEGQELLRKLTLKEIPCTYVLINAVGFIMPEVTKILMGAHALLANGYVMARTGTAQIGLVAKSFNVPVLVCCETHKFSERVQTDAIVYNELGNPDDLVMNESCKLSNWRKGANKILPLNLNYDITPPELVTAVVTEVGVLPCTSVPVILRLKPADLL